MKEDPNVRLAFGPFVLDPGKRLLLRDGRPVTLTSKAFELLVLLAESAETVLPKEELLKRVWPDSFVEEGNLTVQVSMLRKALGEGAAGQQYVMTVPGRGYCFRERVRKLIGEDQAVNAEQSRAAEQSATSPIGRAPGEDAFAGVAPAARSKRVGWSAALVLAAATVVFWLLNHSTPSSSGKIPNWDRGRITFSISPPPDTVFVDPEPAVSPDGRLIAFIAQTSAGTSSLWIRSLDSPAPRPVDGTSGASHPFWSPDSRMIGFFADGKLKRIDLRGGAAQMLTDVSWAPGGGTWSRESGIVFAAQQATLFQIPARGDVPMPVARPKLPPQTYTLTHPEFLPDGQHVLFVARSGAEGREEYVGSLGSKEARRLFSVQLRAIYTPPGYLVFVREGTLLAQRFDPVALRVMSDPVAVIPESGRSGVTVGSFSTSSNGVIAYDGAAQELTMLQWFDRSGKRLESLGSPAQYGNLRISPEGTRVAFDVFDGGTQAREVWIFDSAARRRFRLSFTRSDWQPVWSHDGRQIAFSSFRNGPMNIFRKASDRTGVDDPVMKSDENTFTNDWSPDGRYLAYHVIRQKTNQDLFVLPLAGDRRPITIAATRAIEVLGRFSPDGRFIAYTSNETGRDEVYLQPVPPTGAKWQVSADGGSRPVWRGDGRELFYLARDLKLAAVDVRLDPEVEVGAPQPLFEVDDAALGPGTTKYDVSRDGQRFLVNTRFARAAADRIVVVLNWASGLQP